jgi:hypothetical protein
MSVGASRSEQIGFLVGFARAIGYSEDDRNRIRLGASMPDDQPKQPEFKQVKPTRGKRLSLSILGFSVLEFTGHALEQMQIRGITEEEVIEVLKNPTEKGLPTQPDRHRVRRNKNARIAIDVVYEEEGQTLLVVTAIDVQRQLSRQRRLVERRKK